MKKIKLKELLEQQKDVFEIKDNEEYKQVTVSNTGKIKLRTIKKGAGIGTKKQYKIKSGWFIYSRLGIHQGAFGIVPKELEGAIVTGDMPVFKIDKKQIFPEILIWLLGQRKVKNIFEDLTRGLAQSRIREKYLLNIEIPLPSLSEQKQILKKIQSMENEIKQLEKNVSYDENLLIKLKQSILQEAVQGKLVPQNPKDEPASELLKKIKKEKEKLVRDGKIKKGKELLEIEDDEIPYELPKGWEWCRLGDVCRINPRNYLSDDLEVAFIPMNLIKDNAQNKYEQKIKKWREIKTGFTHFAEEDVVFAKITPCFQNRKSAILENLKNKYGAGTTELYVIRSYNKLILPKFLFFLVNTKKFIEDGVATYKGTAGQQRIKRDFVENYIIGLPPLSEQRRIVEKVDKLMALCDELELKIKENKKSSEVLIGAVLREVF